MTECQCKILQYFQNASFNTNLVLTIDSSYLLLTFFYFVLCLLDSSVWAASLKWSLKHWSIHSHRVFTFSNTYCIMSCTLTLREKKHSDTLDSFHTFLFCASDLHNNILQRWRLCWVFLSLSVSDLTSVFPTHIRCRIRLRLGDLSHLFYSGFLPTHDIYNSDNIDVKAAAARSDEVSDVSTICFRVRCTLAVCFVLFLLDI